MTPEQTLDWLAEQHKSQCNEDRPVQEWIRSMKSMLPAPVQGLVNQRALTVDELITLEQKHRCHEDLSRAIEAKLKEKNA
jgi:hypothetical protein